MIESRWSHTQSRTTHVVDTRFARTQVSKFPNLKDSACMSYCYSNQRHTREPDPTHNELMTCWFINTPLEFHG